MTPKERDNPKIIDGSRRARIAKGAGVEVAEVNSLVTRFFDARKMMESMASGRMPGMPGLPGTGGGKARQPKQQPKKKGGRKVSGNPAKRNAPAQAQAPAIDPAAAFGGSQMDPKELEKAMGDFQLPPELRKMLGNQG
jgi:signal recognition particle subunit SRP54